MNRLVIASHNRKKAGEMVQILSAALPELVVLTLSDFPGAPEPDETGSTYEENALIKARSGASFTNEWCLADDAGLEIDALNGEPGLYSKRFGGEDLPFPQKMSLILAALHETPDHERTARFRCLVALASPDGRALTFEGIREGRIAREMHGQGGFGYDPIFFLPDLECTMAELTAEQKHATSHRGMVLQKVIAHLRNGLKEAFQGILSDPQTH